MSRKYHNTALMSADAIYRDAADQLNAPRINELNGRIARGSECDDGTKQFVSSSSTPNKASSIFLVDSVFCYQQKRLWFFINETREEKKIWDKNLFSSQTHQGCLHLDLFLFLVNAATALEQWRVRVWKYT